MGLASYLLLLSSWSELEVH